MRSITFAQALQFWLKFLALLVPALRAARWSGSTAATALAARLPDRAQRHDRAPSARRSTVRVPVAETAGRARRRGRRARWPGAVELRRRRRTGSARGTRVTLQRGDVVPVVTSLPAQRNESWLRPLGSGQDHPLYASLSLILAICLGHDGPAARAGALLHQPRRPRHPPHHARRDRAAVVVLPAADGVRRARPAVRARTCCSPATPTPPCCCCPSGCSAAPAGVLLGALVTAGAFAAFLSTASGLTVSVAGVLSQDVLRARPASAARPAHPLVPARRGRGDRRAVPAEPAQRAPGPGRRGRAGLRGGRGDVLPAARARHLVARG